LAEVRNIGGAMKIAADYPDVFPSLARLRKFHGQDKAETIIKLFLTDLSELVNLKRSLSERQIDVIAQEVVTTYYSLNLADIHVIFRRARNGEYGELYESLDTPKVIRWFNDYFEERCETSAQSNVSNNYHDKNSNFTSERATKMLDELERKWKIN
jgi:hypothetical protein